MIYQRTILTGNICGYNTLRVEKVWQGWKIGKCTEIFLLGYFIRTSHTLCTRVQLLNCICVVFSTDVCFFGCRTFHSMATSTIFCLFIKINFNLHKFTGFTLEKIKKYPQNENTISWKSTENTVSQVMENVQNTKKIAE